MQPRVVQAGPLAASSATKIALAQTAPGAGYLALNGAAGASTANNICLSQSGTSATALLINGALKQTRYAAPTMGVTGATIAVIPNGGSPITITSAGNDSAINFVVVGMDVNNATVTETIKGSNTSIVASANSYNAILSITPSGNTASTVTAGAMGLATLDTARQVLFTSSGNDSGLTLTIKGTNWAGNPISETVTGGNTTAVTILDYLTITSVKISGATAGTISVGTNGVAGSPWLMLDPWAMGNCLVQCNVTGTVNYTVFSTNDDPDSYANPVSPASVTWDSTYVGIATQTGEKVAALAASPLWMKVVLNSETGTVANVVMTVTQNLSVPY